MECQESAIFRKAPDHRRRIGLKRSPIGPVGNESLEIKNGDGLIAWMVFRALLEQLSRPPEITAVKRQEPLERR